MIDTIECQIQLDNIVITSYEKWTEQSVYINNGRTTERFIYQHEKPDYQPRLVYRRDLERPGFGRLSVEFSIPKLLAEYKPYNVTDEDVRRAFDRVDRFIRVFTGWTIIPSVRQWRVMRIDYAYNFEVGGDMDQYILLVQSLQYKTFTKQTHGVQGVTWLSKSRRRAVKFYDKTAEDYKTVAQTLRFEVSNYRGAIEHLCKKVFKCERVVQELATEARALYVLDNVFCMLGLDRLKTYTADDSLSLFKVYGKQASIAQWVLTLYTGMGVDAYKKGYVNQGTYYAWLRRLKADGFVSSVAQSLAPLVLSPDTHTAHAHTAHAHTAHALAPLLLPEKNENKD